jgi:hypothetical protein
MHPSPQFTAMPMLNNNHLVAFIVTSVDVKAGDELLWKYSVSQGYRKIAPPTPPSVPPPSKTVLSEAIRCAGCKCINPCQSVQHCLTPQVLSSKTRRPGGENLWICNCSNPCSSLKNCLTPQINLDKRSRIKARKTPE